MLKDIELSVTVAFAIEQPKCGLLFHGKYGCTNNQVSACVNPDERLSTQCLSWCVQHSMLYVHACSADTRSQSRWNATVLINLQPIHSTHTALV